MSELNTPPSDEVVNNDIFDRMPFLADALLARLDAAALLQLSCTCQAWRRALQLCQVSLSPKSELAMPFVAGCLHLRCLQLSQMQPAAGACRSHDHTPRSLLSHIRHLTALTRLVADFSLTAAWRGRALELSDADLVHLSALTALQVLSLSHQPCLVQPGPLRGPLAPLSHLHRLTSLALNMTAAPCDTPDATLWHDLAALTTLIHLDLSGLCLCRCCSSSSSDTPTAPADKQQAAQGYGAAGGTAVTGLTGAPDTASSSSSGSGSMLAADGPEAQHGRELPQQGAASNPSSSTHPVWSWCGLLHGQSVRQPGRNSSRAAEGHTGGEPGAGAAESAGTTRSGIRVCEGPAPLQVLSGLTRLQQLVLADWRVPPTHAGILALAHLPHLTLLDISRCCSQPPNPPAVNATTRQPVTLLALLQGTTTQQQQQQQQACCLSSGQMLAATMHSLQDAPQAAPDTAAATPAGPVIAEAEGPASGTAHAVPAVPAAAVPAAWLDRLLCLRCSGLDVLFDGGLWASLRRLTHLDVSACKRLRGHGLDQLTALQELVASDCPQLDYDAMKDLLAAAGDLQVLDLQRSTIILHGGGHTAGRISTGRYRRTLPGKLQDSQQQQQEQGASRPSSRRDVADIPFEDSSTRQVAHKAAMADGQQLAGSSTQAAAGAAGRRNGLRELYMSECQLVFEAFVWQEQPADPHVPPHALLYDLVASSAQQLQQLHVLQWSRADAALASAVLSQLVPRACSSLSELVLSSCGLPEDPSRCWQGLAAATNLRALDLNDTGFSRQGYANPCGTNPTVALLAAVAGMRLEVLQLAGWRFFFATLKPLAGLSDCLAALDLSRARDVTDTTLWSLTHLTSLTWLSLSGARVSNDQTFNLIFMHLSGLKHLDLTCISSFTPRSLTGLLHLHALTSLDIRHTQATANTSTVNTLVKLPSCRRLALSLGGDESYGRDQQWQAASEVSSRGGRCPRVSRGGGGSSSGLEEYAYLGQLGRLQSLRQLVLGGSPPTLTEYCRTLLPPWIDVR